MPGIFQIIKKKRYLRRICTVWLFLIAVEIMCPALCGEQTYAASTSDQNQIETRFNTEAGKCSSETSLSSCDSQGKGDHGVVCNDECTCHADAFPGLFYLRQKELLFRAEATVFELDRPIFSSVPPPYPPPKSS